jgi:hypothetical protein
MPHTTWATDEQEEWFKSHIVTFLDVHQKKTLSKDFFPIIVKEFRDKWPPREPTAEEIVDVSSIEEANKTKRTKYDKVKLLLLLQDRWLRYMLLLADANLVPQPYMQRVLQRRHWVTRTPQLEGKA